MDMYALVLFVAFAATTCLTAKTAERRGRSVKVWTWLGVIFGPLAWVVVLLLPAVKA